MKELEIDIEPSIEQYLLKKDLEKLRKFNRDHDHGNMAKQKAMEHDKLRKELEARYKNIAKNMEYSPMVGCDTVNERGVRTRYKSAHKVCQHKLYGCTGGVNSKTAHKSEASKYCTFHGKIERIRNAYFIQYPDAKAEYENMYPDKVMGKVRKRKGAPGKCYVLIKLYSFWIDFYRQKNLQNYFISK